MVTRRQESERLDGRAARLGRLRRLLEETSDFGEAMSAFFDLTDADRDLFADTVPCATHPELEGVIRQSLPDVLAHGGAVTGPPPGEGTWLAVCDLRLGRLEGHAFVHGTLRVAGRYGSILYFERHRVGLLGLAMGGGVMHYARFRCLPTAPQDPTRN